MANYLVTDTQLTATADAIREKTGGTDLITWDESKGFSDAVSGISAGGGGDIDAFIDGSITEVSSNVTTVKDYVFYNATSLKNVSLPNAEIIKYYAFQKCKNLTDVSIPNVEILRPYAFAECKSLKNVYAPKVYRTEGSVFKQAGIEKICLPRCTQISSADFNNCQSLRIIDIGATSYSSVIVSNSCYYAKALVAFVLRTSRISTLDKTDAFGETPIASGTGYIYVPRALIEDYKVATNWTIYASQFRVLEDYTVDGTTTGELDESKI